MPVCGMVFAGTFGRRRVRGCHRGDRIAAIGAMLADVLRGRGAVRGRRRSAQWSEFDYPSRTMAEPTTRRELLRRAGPAGLLGIVWTAAPAICGILLLWYIAPLSELLQARPALGLTAYVAIFIISAGLGFLPTYAQALLGGWVFGVWIGTPAALAGFTGAAMLGYFIARLVSRDRIESLIEDNDRARAVRQAMVGRGFWPTLGVVTLLRLPPNSPFALTNLAMASAGVRKIPYVLGTAIGMAPRTTVATAFAHMGAATGSKDLQTLARESGWPVVVGGLVVMVIVLMILGAIANRAIERVNAGLPPVEPDEMTDDGPGPADGSDGERGDAAEDELRDAPRHTQV